MEKLSKYIDHTLLKQGCTEDEIKKLCDEAIKYNFAAVCVPPFFVEFCSSYLRNMKPKVCTVIGFPFSYTDIETMKAEIKAAIKNGAQEIDIVQNVSLVKMKEWDLLSSIMKSLFKEIVGIVKVKIILETGLLTEEEIKKCCEIYKPFLIDGDFIKTSTGFAKEISNVDEFQKQKLKAVQIIKEVIGNRNIGIKASGGIKDVDFATKLIEAGATRLGCSSGVQLIENISISEGGY